MVCKTCGRLTQNEEANFCEYCGSSFREQAQTVTYIEPQRTYNTVEQGGQEKPISFLSWLATYGILLIPTLIIPLVGWVVPIVMLFVWSFHNRTQASKKNWARATLIFLAVYIIIMITVLMYMVNSPIFKEMMNGTFDFNSLYNSAGLK